MQYSHWIERDSNGRAYYARQKPLFSFRRLLAEAFHDIRTNNRFSDLPATASSFSSSSQQSTNAPRPAQPSTGSRVNTPKPKSNMQKSRATTPQAQPSMAGNNNTNPPPNQPQSQYPQYPFQYPMYPSFQPYPNFPQPNPISENIQRQEFHFAQPDQGALTHYATPHPRMYPYIPPGSNPLALPPMIPQSTPGGQPQQGGPPTAHHMPQPGMPSFPTMSSVHTPMTGVSFSQDPEKPKCSECGRNRSSRYRWKHPRQPGQSARPNICRRCRKTGTDSEDEGSNSEDDKDGRRKSRNRHRSRGRTSRPLSRARSSSRPIQRNDFEYYQSDKSSSSDGSNYDQPRVRNRSCRRPKSRSSSNEVTRHHDPRIHRSRSRSKRVVYVDTPKDRIESSDSEGDVEIRYVDHYPR